MGYLVVTLGHNMGTVAKENLLKYRILGAL